jgi:tRNA-dihydrouridine synthase
MKDPTYALDVIRTMSESVSCPFGIKVRTGLTNEDKDDRFDLLVRASEHCSMVSIHGRTFKQ